MRLNVFAVQKWFSRVDRNTKDFTRNEIPRYYSFTKIMFKNIKKIK